MATAYKLTIDRRGMDRDARAIGYREVVKVTRRVFNRANVLTPVRLGRLRAGNQMRTRRVDLTGEIWNDTEYAIPVHDGAPAYTVVPKRRKALRFVVDGRWVYARRVVIPARRGRPWLYRALKEVAVAGGYRFTGGAGAP